MPSFGNLFASLTLQSASFMSGMKAVDKKMAETQKRFNAIGSRLQTVGAGMSVAITAPFIALMTTSMQAAGESDDALASVKASLASMGDAAGRSVEQLQALAGHLQDVSLFDDDDILRKVTTNLLTFGAISGDVFDRAQAAIVDISAKMGTDLQSATMMVGKALQDPVKGLTALTRVGLNFTAQQQEQIKAMVAAGDAAGAQKIILAGLEQQVKGSAQALRDASPTADMQQQWRTLQETLGAFTLKLLPPLNDMAAKLLGFFNNLSPATQGWAVGIAAVAAALGPVLIGLGGVVTAMGALLPVLTTTFTFITATAIPALASFVVAAAPVLLPLAAVAAAIIGVYEAVKHWDEIKAIAQRLYAAIKTWVLDKLNAVWDAVKAKVDAVGDWFHNLWDRVVGHSYIPDMVDAIGVHMARLQENLVNPARAATDAAAQAFQQLQQSVGSILNELFPQQARRNEFENKLATLTDGMAKLGFSADQTAAAVARLRAEYSDLPGALGGNAQAVAIGFDQVSPTVSIDVEGAMSEVVKMAETTTKKWLDVSAANDNLGDSFATMTRNVTGALQNLSSSIKSGDWLGALQGVLDVVTQLGSTGLFGKSFQASVSSFRKFGGGRAVGGPVLANTDYLVGERGPEILRMGGRGGSIVPNNQIGGPSMVTIAVEEGALFRPVVTGISGHVAVETSAGMQKSVARRQSRSLAA